MHATRTMLMQNENARLRDDLVAARSELGDMRQSNYLLGQMGRWTGNPPCPMPWNDAEQLNSKWGEGFGSPPYLNVEGGCCQGESRCIL